MEERAETVIEDNGTVVDKVLYGEGLPTELDKETVVTNVLDGEGLPIELV